MFTLTFEVAGDVQLSRAFSRFAEDIKDASEPFKSMADDFHKTVEPKQFSSQGGYGSGGWKALSPNYAAWKAANYPGRPILVLTGLMKESLLGENPWSIEDIEPLRMEIGTKIGYAIFHQKGTRKMPARPPIDLTEADKKRWTNIFHKWLVDKSNKEFAGLMPTIGAGQSHVKKI